VEEEGRLADPRLRENFIERVFAYRRLRTLLAGRLTAGRLVASTPRTSSSSWPTRRRPTPRSAGWWRRCAS